MTTTRFVAMSSKATTRAQKRRMGERDVWDLIVKCDDICFKHILPRLNSTTWKSCTSEYGDEKVDQEIISQGGVEREV